MEAWTHGNAVAFDPDIARSGLAGNDLNVGVNGASLKLNPDGADGEWLWFNFPWPLASTLAEERPLTVDEVLVRARLERSDADVSLTQVLVRDREVSVLSTRLEDPVKPKVDFTVMRFPGERPQGWTDFDTPIAGPLSVGLEIRRSGPTAGGVRISAVGIRFRLAYVGR